MKRLTAEELRSKEETELQRELQAALKELFKLRLQKAVGEVSNTAQFKQLKRYVARIKTVLRLNTGKNA